MTDSPTELPRGLANGTQAPASEPVEAIDQDPYADGESDPAGESAPGTPRWVKAFGIMLVVLLLAFAGLHLTGNAPTHMPGSSAPQHSLQAP
jgi:hypothetical protein